MILMGDEYGHTKHGNNNTYCHDNSLNWVDWDKAGDTGTCAGLTRFCRLMNMFRACHPAFHLEEFPTEQNIQWHGHRPHEPMWEEDSRFIAFSLYTPDDVPLYIAFNSNHLPAQLELPEPPANYRWRLVSDTSISAPFDFLDDDELEPTERAAAEAMVQPAIDALRYTLLDRASMILRAELIVPS